MRLSGFLAGLSVVTLAAVGCSGADGQTGPAGADGADGADGIDATALPPTDTFFSFAVTNNSGGVHRGVNVLTLDFDGSTPSATTVVSNKASSPPAIDGTDGGTDEWGTHESAVTFDAGTASMNGITAATLRSLYTDTDIYFFAKWTETANDGQTIGASTARKTYAYDSVTGWGRTGNEDRAFFAFPIDDAGFSTGGCTSACHNGGTLMSTPLGKKWDVWHWKATRTGPSQTLDDKWWDDGLANTADGRKSDQGLSAYWEPGAETAPEWMPGSYVAGTGVPFSGPVWAWEVVPFDSGAGWAPGDGFPGSIARLPTGSRGDVTAVAKWDTDTWTLEIKRARVTGNGDDYQF